MNAGLKHERRRTRRLNCVVEVQLSGGGPIPLVRGRLEDISVTGIFIDTPTTFLPDLSSGSEIDIKFTLPGLPEIAVKGMVAWIREGVGIGVEFQDLSEDRRKTIETFMQKMLR